MDKTLETNGRVYAQYRLTADLLCLGERMRGSVFRPCLEVLPCTALEGAFRARFPHPDRRVYAAGHFRKKRKEVLVYAPRDRHCGHSKIPLQIEYLADVEADVYVLLNDWTTKWPDNFDMQLGAMRPQGFGRCKMEKRSEVPASHPKPGKLGVRMLDDETTKEMFGVRQVMSAIYGYLFVPDHGKKGHYERGLFEGSDVVADPIVLKREVSEDKMLPDPVEKLLAELGNDTELVEGWKRLKQKDRTTFCHNVAEVFYAHGCEVTELYLLDKAHQKATKAIAELVQRAVCIMRENNKMIIEDNRGIGMTILKSLPIILQKNGAESS